MELEGFVDWPFFNISSSGFHFGVTVLLSVRANREVGPIRVVTSRPLEAGFKPDKSQSAPFALNKTNPFGP